MAKFEQREGSGILFPKDNKKEDKYPDWTGEAKINGVMMDLAAWNKQGKNGKFLSLSIKPKREKPAAESSPAKGKNPLDEWNDDPNIPF